MWSAEAFQFDVEHAAGRQIARRYDVGARQTGGQFPFMAFDGKDLELFGKSADDAEPHRVADFC